MEDEAEGEQARAERRVRERLALESDGAPRGTLGLDEVLDAINGDGRDRELAKVRDEMPLGERAVVVQRARADRVERRVPTEPLLSDRGERGRGRRRWGEGSCVTLREPSLNLDRRQLGSLLPGIAYADPFALALTVVNDIEPPRALPFSYSYAHRCSPCLVPGALTSSARASGPGR